MYNSLVNSQLLIQLLILLMLAIVCSFCRIFIDYLTYEKMIDILCVAYTIGIIVSYYNWVVFQ